MRKRRFHDSFNEGKKEKKKLTKPRYLSDIEANPELNNEELGMVIADALYEQKPELIGKYLSLLLLLRSNPALLLFLIYMNISGFSSPSGGLTPASTVGDCLSFCCGE